MVALPIPSINPVLTESPRSSVSGGAFQQPQRVGIGSGIEAIAQGVDEIAKVAAEKQGAADAAAAVQRNADGSLSSVNNQQDHFLFGPAAQAYEHAYQVGSLASLETEVDQKSVDLRQQFKDDPQGLRVAMGEYADALRAKLPGPLGQVAFNYATKVGSQHYISAVEDKRQAGMESSYHDTVARIGAMRSQIENIAGTHYSDSPEFIDKTPEFAQLKAYYLSLGDNDKYKQIWTPQKIENEINLARQEAVDQWALGNAQRIRDRDGIDAAIKWSEKNVRDANSIMDPGKREAAHNMVVARIKTLTEEQRAQAQASSAAVDGFTKLYQDGTPPTQEQYEAVLDSARRSFDVAGAAKLQAFHDAYLNSVKPYAGLSPREGVSATMGPQPTRVFSNVDAADAAMKLTPQERALYDRHFSNLIGSGGVDNEDGSRSTLFATTVNIGGKEYVLPTVYDGKKVSVDEAVSRAKKQGLDNFPSYASNEEAQARYGKLHSFMERDTKQLLEQRAGGKAFGPLSSSAVHNAIVGQESNWNPNAKTSVTGATGIGQIQPATFERYAKPGEKITNPVDNLAVSRRIIDDLYQKFNGDPQRVAVAYFSGEGNVAPAGSATPWKADKADPTGKTTSSYVSDVTKRLGGGPVVAGPASPVPFSADDLRRNPFLAAASTSMFLNDRARQIQFARDQGEIITKAIGMGVVPEPQAVARVLQIAQQNPRELGEMSTKIDAAVKAAPFALEAAGMPDGGKSYMQEVDNWVRQKPDLYRMSFSEAFKNQVEGRAKALKDDPHAYAARPDVGWIKNRPIPLDAIAAPQEVGADSPQAVLSAAISQRREAAFQIAPRLGVAPEQAMFTKNDVQSVAGLLQRADGAGASTILRGLDAGLRPEEMQALAGNKDFTNAVAGLARSGDPEKVGAAYSFMDKQQRDNPLAFAKEYGDDTANKMAVWQGKIAFMGQEQAMKALQQLEDPNFQKLAEPLKNQAHDETKDLTPTEVVNKAFDTIFTMQPGDPVSDSLTSSGVELLRDFKENYAAVRMTGGDKALAEAEATKRVQQKWGASTLNDGRVMAYPPERYYPPDINGSRAYIQNQLSDAIDEAAVKYQGRGVDPAKLRAAPRALVSDRDTETDIANRIPPSYKIVVKDDVGRWVPLEARPNVPLRFRADAQSVIEGQTQDFLVRRRQSGFVQGAM